MDSPLRVCPEISNPAAAAASGSDGCHIIRAHPGQGGPRTWRLGRRLSGLSSAQLLSERGNIDDRPLFHDPPGREAKEGHALDADARAVAGHAAGGHGVRANHLPVHRDLMLVGDRTLYRHLEIRHRRSPGLGRCAVLLEGVVSRGAVRYEIPTVDLVEPGE